MTTQQDIPKPSFEQALKILGIEIYAERIFKSSSTGELFHLEQYISFAAQFKDTDLSWFPIWFTRVVEYAENDWQYPEYVFQHMLRIFAQTLEKKEQIQNN